MTYALVDGVEVPPGASRHKRGVAGPNSIKENGRQIQIFKA